MKCHFRSPASRVVRSALRTTAFRWCWPRVSMAFLLVWGVLAGCGPVEETGCPCIICQQSAVRLTIVTPSGEPIEDFWVEHIVNGEGRGEPEGCRRGETEGNECAFGRDVGLYDLVISAPGFQPTEARIRVAPTGTPELCCSACLSGERLRVVMVPQQPS